MRKCDSERRERYQRHIKGIGEHQRVANDIGDVLEGSGVQIGVPLTVLVNLISINEFLRIIVTLILFKNGVRIKNCGDHCAGGCLDLLICCFGLCCIGSCYPLAVFERGVWIGAIAPNVSCIENSALVTAHV
jgi:hypothetical protein